VGNWFDNLFKTQDEDAIIRESRVSKKFQEMTTMRVVSIVLICIMVTPFLDADVFMIDSFNPADYLAMVIKMKVNF